MHTEPCGIISKQDFLKRVEDIEGKITLMLMCKPWSEGVRMLEARVKCSHTFVG